MFLLLSGLQLLDLLLQPLDMQLLLIQLLLVLVLSVIHFPVEFFMLHEVFLGFLLNLVGSLSQFGLNFFPAFPLAFVSLFVLDDFTLAFVHDLQEKVFHK